MKSDIAFEKTGWLKRQNPAACCAFDILRAGKTAGAHVHAFPHRSTLAGIFNLGDVHLIVYRDFSALLGTPLSDEDAQDLKKPYITTQAYSLYPDAVRLKRALRDITLTTSSEYMNSKKAHLRVQVQSKISQTIPELESDHPMIESLTTEVAALVSQSQWGAPTDFSQDWCVKDLHHWEQPDSKEEGWRHIGHEANYLLGLLGQKEKSFFSCTLPFYENGRLHPFAPVSRVTSTAHPLLKCLNTPSVFPVEKYIVSSQRQTFRLTGERDGAPLSAHRCMQLAQLAQTYKD